MWVCGCLNKRDIQNNLYIVMENVSCCATQKQCLRDNHPVNNSQFPFKRWTMELKKSRCFQVGGYFLLCSNDIHSALLFKSLSVCRKTEKIELQSHYQCIYQSMSLALGWTWNLASSSQDTPKSGFWIAVHFLDSILLFFPKWCKSHHNHHHAAILPTITLLQGALLRE